MPGFLLLWCSELQRVIVFGEMLTLCGARHTASQGGGGVDGVTDRLFVDLTVDGRVSVGTWLEDELPGGAAGEPCTLAWPLDADALEELRWYLEDYLRVPFGVYESRGPGVATRLAAWGEAVFGTVFGPGPARDAYQRIRARPAGAQVVFRRARHLC